MVSGTRLVYVGQDDILSALDAKTGDIKASIALPGAVHGFTIDKKANKLQKESQFRPRGSHIVSLEAT